MKQQLNEIKRMQQLAGIVKEAVEAADLVVGARYEYEGKRTLEPDLGKEITGEFEFIETDGNLYIFKVITITPETGNLKPGRRFITSKEGLQYLTKKIEK